jgi:hypothetical protein
LGSPAWDFFFPIVAILLCRPLFGIDFLNIPTLFKEYTNSQVVNATMFMQVFYAIGLFALPALTFRPTIQPAFAFVFAHRQTTPISAFGSSSALHSGLWPIPRSNRSLKCYRGKFPLPEWAQTAEDNADALVKAFMQADGFPTCSSI